MRERLGVIGIIVKGREDSAGKINDILSEYGEFIVGRMGVPYREKGFSVISLIVDGTTDKIGALTGKLGKVNGVQVKSVLIDK